MIRICNQLSSPRIIQVSPDCLQIRGHIVHHYALREEGRITLLDGGFLACRPKQTLAEFRKLGHSPKEICSILVSHGHIDHTLHLREWQELTGAKIYAPAADRDHILACHHYRGASRVCGSLEAFARYVFDYEPPEVDCWFLPGDEIPVWGGLEVIDLSGHTLGHSGFYSRRRELLFANDLFAHWLDRSYWPPSWLNDSTKRIRNSAMKADQLPLGGGLLLNHCDESSPRQMRERLARLLND